VRTDVARELLVDGLFDAAWRRTAGEAPASVAAALGDALLHAVDEPSQEDATTRRAAALAARLGYETRAVERERFPAARSVMPGLDARLGAVRRDEGDPLAASVRVSAALARDEPSHRPAPDEEAPSWATPGPGGHVRHYLAVRAARAAGEAGATALGAADLKRCWMFGFFLACCGETPPHRGR
jgi:hypothetical protein